MDQPQEIKGKFERFDVEEPPKSDKEKEKEEKEKQSKAGLPKHVYFIFTTETMERFSYYGFRALLALYLKNFMKIGENESESTVHFFMTGAYLTPLLGAVIADVWWGRFKTIFWLSLVYLFGQVFMVFSAVEDLTHRALWPVILALVLIAFGTGGIKPNVSAFGADQIAVPKRKEENEKDGAGDINGVKDEKVDEVGAEAGLSPGENGVAKTPEGGRPRKRKGEAEKEQQKLITNYFNIFYACINFGSIFSTILIPVVKREVGYLWAFTIPAILLAVSIGIFFGGNFVWGGYRQVPPTGSALLKFFGVIFCVLSTKCSNLCGRGEGENAWDVATAKYGSAIVKDTQAALKVLVVFLPLPAFWMGYDQQASTWTTQAEKMDLHIFPNVEIEAEQWLVINPILILILIPLFMYLIYPLFEKSPKKLFKPTPLKKMMVGMLLACLSFLIAGLVQRKIDSNIITTTPSTTGSPLNGTTPLPTITPSLPFTPSLPITTSAPTSTPKKEEKSDVSIWLQLPQYVIISVAEILFSVTGLEFAYSESPESMRSVMQAFWMLTTAVGNLIASGTIAFIPWSVERKFYLFSLIILFCSVVFFLITLWYQYNNSANEATSMELMEDETSEILTQEK